MAEFLLGVGAIFRYEPGNTEIEKKPVRSTIDLVRGHNRKWLEQDFSRALELQAEFFDDTCHMSHMICVEQNSTNITEYVFFQRFTKSTHIDSI